MCESICERFAVDQFHDYRVSFKAIDGGDIRVVQRSEHTRLALESLYPLRIS